MTEIKVSTDDLAELGNDFYTLSGTASLLAAQFQSAAHGFSAADAFGDSRLTANYEAAYQQSLTAVNQVTESLETIGRKLALVAANYSNASAASTPKPAG